MPRSNPELSNAMGKRMAERRKVLGLSQEAVAEAAGLGFSQYNKAENGKSCLSSDSLLRISEALRISADYLLTGNSDTSRYQNTVDILEQMDECQVRLANKLLQCIVDECSDTTTREKKSR